MADRNRQKGEAAERRRRRVRGKVVGSAGRPRLTVARSLKNVFVQIVDDENRVTLVGVGSDSKVMKDAYEVSDTKTARARKVGLKVAELATAKGIDTVVFDRNRYPYHGRIKAVAEGAREGGLTF